MGNLARNDGTLCLVSVYYTYIPTAAVSSKSTPTSNKEWC